LIADFSHSQDGTATVYHQTRLRRLRDTNDQIINTPGLNQAFEVTVVSQFQMSFTASNGVMTFGQIQPNGQNTLRMFFDDDLQDDPAGTGGDDLTGTGFFDGQLIFEGRPDGLLGGQVALSLDGATTPLDLHSSNDFPGQVTLLSGGRIDLAADTTHRDGDFFTSGDLARLLFEADLGAPFGLSDPSAVFGDGAVTPDLGPINGQGADAQFQVANGRTAFVIPEPGGLALLGLGALLAPHRRCVQRTRGARV